MQPFEGCLLPLPNEPPWQPRGPFRSGVTSVLLSARSTHGSRRASVSVRVLRAVGLRDFGVAFMGGPPRRSIKITGTARCLAGRTRLRRKRKKRERKLRRKRERGRKEIQRAIIQEPGWNTPLINLPLKPPLLQPAAAILHRLIVLDALFCLPTGVCSARLLDLRRFNKKCARGVGTSFFLRPLAAAII